MADIVPFGKYKNQPLTALAQDKQYCEWLAGQGWVAQRYPEIHTVIINNFAEPSETPEHNALQLRFLDESTRCKGHWIPCGAFPKGERADGDCAFDHATSDRGRVTCRRCVQTHAYRGTEKGASR